MKQHSGAGMSVVFLLVEGVKRPGGFMVKRIARSHDRFYGRQHLDRDKHRFKTENAGKGDQA